MNKNIYLFFSNFLNIKVIFILNKLFKYKIKKYEIFIDYKTIKNIIDNDNYKIGINLIKDNFYSKISEKISMLKNFNEKYLFYTKDNLIKKIKKIYKLLVKKNTNFDDKIPNFAQKLRELNYDEFEKNFINSFNNATSLVCLNNDYYYKIEYYDNYPNLPESTINLYFNPFNHQFTNKEVYDYEDEKFELMEDLDDQMCRLFSKNEPRFDNFEWFNNNKENMNLYFCV